MAESLSTNGKPNRLARRLPTVDLPAPIKPTSTIGRSRRSDSFSTRRGYTWARVVGQKAGMSRPLLVLIVLALLLIGGAVFLSRSAREVPAKPIEVDVSRDSQG
jgi:hypothetical protein